MAYQRAQWHSGLTYQQICDNCKNTVNYTDHNLDFRPWFPDGYVDCPVCKSHLRHHEKYAVNASNTPGRVATSIVKEEPPMAPPVAPTYTPDNTTAAQSAHGDSVEMAAFCGQCGNKFRDNDRFCVKCGTKRV